MYCLFIATAKQYMITTNETTELNYVIKFILASHTFSFCFNGKLIVKGEFTKWWRHIVMQHRMHAQRGVCVCAGGKSSDSTQRYNTDTLGLLENNELHESSLHQPSAAYIMNLISV